jgi:hypothetical protein
MKKVLFSSALFLFALVFLKNESAVHAQGTYYCDIDTGECIGDQCDDGYVANCPTDDFTGLCTWPTSPTPCIAAPPSPPPPPPPPSQNPTCDINGKKGIDTAIGCIPIEDTNSLIGFILKWAIGVGGGIAFLLILVAGFQIMTSTGDPKRLQAGKELLTSAVAGLILLIFSVFILRIIGVDILGIFPARP